MNQEEAKKLNEKTSLQNKFYFEVDGIDKKFVASASFPYVVVNVSDKNKYVTNCGDFSVSSLLDDPNRLISVNFYYNAAPELINWIKNKDSKRKLVITVLDNMANPYIKFVTEVKLDAVQFGLGDYSSDEPMILTASLKLFGLLEFEIIW